MDIDLTASLPIKSEVTIKETFSLYEEYGDNENARMKSEPVDIKENLEQPTKEPIKCKEEYITDQSTSNEYNFNLTNKESDNKVEKYSYIVYQYSCYKCAFKTTSIGRLKMHLKNHEGGHKYKCADCNFKTECKSSLMNHWKVHKDGYEYNCKECNFKTQWKTSLQNHSKKHHGYSYICTKCNKFVPCTLDLIRHMFKHK